MTSQPTATVVVVCRDRWSLAPETLGLLLARTDPRHPVVVVDARAPRTVSAVFDRLAADGRIRVTRCGRFLASNEARNLGADGVRTDWVAFVENDAVLNDGWLEILLESGAARDAASVYPAYLEHRRDGLLVHGIGADLDVGGTDGLRSLRERQHDLGRAWPDLADELVPVARVQAEPHAVVLRRELLEQMGGLDEAILSWFDHTDLALHHQRLGAESWFEPRVTCLYRSPPPVALQDLPSFSLRWGADWFDQSLHHLCTTWGLDPHDTEWTKHADYRTFVRRSVLSPWARVNAVLDRAAAPIDWCVAQQWDARRRRMPSATRPSV